MGSSPLKLFPSVSNVRPSAVSSSATPQTQQSKTEHIGISTVAIRVQSQPELHPRVQPAHNNIKHALPRTHARESAQSANTVVSQSQRTGSPSQEQYRDASAQRTSMSQAAQASATGTVVPVAAPSISSAKPTPAQDASQGQHANAKQSLSTSLPKLSCAIQPDHSNPMLDNVPSPSTFYRESVLYQSTSILSYPDASDRLSPPPSNTASHLFTLSELDKKIGYPSRSNTPTLDRSDSTAKTQNPPCPPYTAPARSLFPQYDHSRPMHQQSYYPTTNAGPSTPQESDGLRSATSPMEKQPEKRYDSAVGLLEGYEHIPTSSPADVEAVWKASCEAHSASARKVQFTLSSGHGLNLAVGTSRESTIFALEEDYEPQKHHGMRHLSVKKQSPSAASSILVAQISTRDRHEVGQTNKSSTSIFPHQATIDAVAAMPNTHKTRSTISFGTALQSEFVEEPAKEAIAEAHRKHGCNLSRRTRQRDSLGTVMASYELCHPTLGKFPVTVTKSLAPGSISGPRAKISLHHPTATPAAVTADTLNLAFLDFARDACVLDIPGLLALDGRYVIDTVLSALFAVAVIENDTLATENMTFDAPPREPIKKAKSKAMHRVSTAGSTKSKKSLFRRSTSKKMQSNALEPVGEQVELPVLTQGALAVIGMSLKTAVWVFTAGAKVTTGLVLGADHLAKKL